MIAIPCALILRQPDLGTSLLIAAAGLFGVFMAGIGWRFISVPRWPLPWPRPGRPGCSCSRTTRSSAS
jgi:uncharacterized protein (DUF58 family)